MLTTGTPERNLSDLLRNAGYAGFLSFGSSKHMHRERTGVKTSRGRKNAIGFDCIGHQIIMRKQDVTVDAVPRFCHKDSDKSQSASAIGRVVVTVDHEPPSWYALLIRKKREFILTIFVFDFLSCKRMALELWHQRSPTSSQWKLRTGILNSGLAALLRRVQQHAVPESGCAAARDGVRVPYL